MTLASEGSFYVEHVGGWTRVVINRSYNMLPILEWKQLYFKRCALVSDKQSSQSHLTARLTFEA